MGFAKNNFHYCNKCNFKERNVDIILTYIIYKKYLVKNILSNLTSKKVLNPEFSGMKRTEEKI